jgi:hypothetical protein
MRGELLENDDPPRHAELGHYREMAEVLRTLTLPSDGYGDEPKSEADVRAPCELAIGLGRRCGWAQCPPWGDPRHLRSTTDRATLRAWAATGGTE